MSSGKGERQSGPRQVKTAEVDIPAAAELLEQWMAEAEPEERFNT